MARPGWDDPALTPQSGPARRTAAAPAPAPPAYNSPITTRSGRALGTNQGKAGPGYSPYARRTYPAHPPPPPEPADPPPPPLEDPPSGAGVLNALKHLPARALGYIFARGGPAKPPALPASHSMADMRSLATEHLHHHHHSADEERALAATGAPRGRGLPPSASLASLSSLAHSSAYPRLASHPTTTHPRTAHRTLSLAPASSRGLSPAAPSPTSRRSPSPTRNTLAGSMSTIHVSSSAHPPRLHSPTSASASAAAPPATNPFAVVHPSQSPFGLTSKSPFAQRSPTTSLFPYSSGSLRGSPAPSQPSHFGRSSGHPNGGPPGGSKRAVSSVMSQAGDGGARSGSPLNPMRKKQLVWDPEQGLVSRQALERARAEAAPPLPKNEAERILEVLEGMGRTPMGDAKRASTTTGRSQINVPVPSYAPKPPAASPYSHREGKGLASVLAAREERRRKAMEELRKVAEEEKREARHQMEHDDEPAPPVAEPRRKTRSMAREEKSGVKLDKGKGKGKGNAAPTPRKGRKKRNDSVLSTDVDSPSPPPKSPTKASRAAAAPPPPPRKLSSPPPPAPPVEKPPPQPVPNAASKPASSLRPGRTHSSRAHQAGAHIFSANEEDLPPVEAGALGMIQLKIPDGFSFGSSSAVPAAAPPASSSSSSSSAPVPAPATNGSALLGRLGPIKEDSAPPPATTSAFSFTPAPASSGFSFASTEPATSKPTPPPSTFSFGAAPPASTSSSSSSSSAPAPPALTPFSFGSKESTPNPPASTPFSFSAPTTTSAPKPFSFGDASAAPLKNDLFSSASSGAAGGAKPNFFAGVLGENKDDKKAPTPPAFPSFAFGAPAPSVSEASEAKAAPAPASNPFAAFGKPIAEIVKEGEAQANGASAGEEKKNGTPAPPAFGLFGSAQASAPPAEKSPFSFTSTPSSTPSTTPSFTFGAPAAKPTRPVAVPTIEDADEDSGMEDEAPVAADPVSAPPKVEFSFGAKPDASTPLFGAAPATSTAPLFGAPPAPATPSFFDAKPAAATPLFGTSATSPAPAFGGAAPANPFGTSSTPNLFGAASTATPSWGSLASTAATTTTPAFGGTGSLFGGATAPAPGAFHPPPTSAPMFGSTFGAATSMAPTLSTGSSTGAAPSPFGAAPAPALGGFSFGAPPQSSTPGGTPFTFGAAAPANGGTAPTFGGFGAPAAAPVVFGAAPAMAASASVPGSPSGSFFNVGSGGEESAGKGGRKIAPLRRRRP